MGWGIGICTNNFITLNCKRAFRHKIFIEKQNIRKQQRAYRYAMRIKNNVTQNMPLGSKCL